MAGQGHAAYHANRTVWGDGIPREQDFLRHPDGPGWHLDRSRFDQGLRDCAVARGAKFMGPTRIEQLKVCGGHWRAEVSNESGLHIITADIFVEAGGRRSPLARSLGTRREIDGIDRLTCSWVHLRDNSSYGGGITIVEATSEGWWYTAPVPNGVRVLAFHTDRDLPAARIAAEPAKLAIKARASTREVARALKEWDESVLASGYTQANGSFLSSSVGENWLAVGDAALATDPIAARGLLHAMYTGLAGAAAIERRLSGEHHALSQYASMLKGLIAEYRRGRHYCYGQESRFPNSAFWQRRNWGR